MSKIEKVDKGKTINLLHGGDGGLVIPKPFNRQIFLFETHIAGTSHIENMDKLAEKIEIGTRVSFYREASNEYDPGAIKVEVDDGSKIGYIPKADNPVFARLMDAGKLLFGKVKEKGKKENWYNIKIYIYLDD